MKYALLALAAATSMTTPALAQAVQPGFAQAEAVGGDDRVEPGSGHAATPSRGAVRGAPGDVRVPYAEGLRTHALAVAVAQAAATGRAVTPAVSHA